MGISIKKQTAIWRTKDGKKSRICDIEDSHLLNIIKYLERRAELIYSYRLHELIRADSIISGEMATMAIENELLQLEEKGADPFEFPIYNKMLHERDRRKLKCQ
jgi:hypothetical protein